MENLHEMSINELGAIHWDLYKEVYGYRPRNIDTEMWTVDDFVREIENLFANW